MIFSFLSLSHHHTTSWFGVCFVDLDSTPFRLSSTVQLSRTPASSGSSPFHPPPTSTKSLLPLLGSLLPVEALLMFTVHGSVARF